MGDPVGNMFKVVKRSDTTAIETVKKTYINFSICVRIRRGVHTQEGTW